MSFTIEHKVMEIISESAHRIINYGITRSLRCCDGSSGPKYKGAIIIVVSGADILNWNAHTRHSLSPLRPLSTPYLWASRVRFGRRFRDSRALTVVLSNMHQADAVAVVARNFVRVLYKLWYTPALSGISNYISTRDLWEKHLVSSPKFIAVEDTKV